MPEKRVTVSIRKDLHRWLKIWAVQEGLTIQEATDHVIEQFKEQQANEED